MRRKFLRFDDSAKFRLIVILVVGGTLLMWLRASLLRTDSFILRSPKRVYRLESGFGEVRFEIAFRPGNGWDLEMESTGVGGRPHWFEPFEYERTLLSLSIGAGYWIIVLVEGVVLHIWFYYSNRKRKRKPKGRAGARKRRKGTS